jgi:hypothetical protein
MEIQVIVADSEGALLISTYRLETVTSKYAKNFNKVKLNNDNYDVKHLTNKVPNEVTDPNTEWSMVTR